MPSEVTASHQCPIRGCRRWVGAEFVMCGPHWKLVAPQMQANVYRHYRQDFGSDAYFAARGEAIAWVNRGLSCSI